LTGLGAGGNNDAFVEVRMHDALAAAMTVADLLAHSGWVAKMVLITLLVFSLISWSIMIDGSQPPAAPASRILRGTRRSQKSHMLI
jgi:hypothetical protein